MRAHKIVEAGLAQVPEGRHVFLHMTVEENLDMGAYTQPASHHCGQQGKGVHPSSPA